MIPVKNFSGTIEGLVLSLIDVTGRTLAEKRKDEFISIASHELKTPLTSIKAYIQIMHKKYEDYYLQRVEEQIVKLITLVNDLLDVSKMQVGNFNFYNDLFSKDFSYKCRKPCIPNRAMTINKIVVLSHSY